jgi:arylsulfatase A-like enzyme
MAKSGKPNILILWGDDIGWWNISYNNRGQMGYRTPNIDRIGHEGATFTDYYGQQSCTAGRAAFITGQNPIRTGLTKVGMPGADVGLRAADPTIADLLKPLGYATGQFGKNHLGDKDEFLPTAHGFDEFFGNLYHLMRRKSRRIRTIRRTRNSRSGSDPEVYCTAGPTARADKGSRIPAPSLKSAWKPSMKR